MAEVVEDDTVESMDDTIRETLRELNEREDLGEPDIKAPKSEAKPETKSEKQEAKPAKSEAPRARDETGKFAKTESVAAAEQPDTIPSPGATEQTAADVPLVTTTGQPIDLNRPPASWKPAAKAQWAALPEPIRAEIYRREGDYLKGNGAIKEVADFGQSVKTIVEPYRMLIEAEGGTPEAAIRDTLKTAALFRVGTPQQKLQALFTLDQQFNAGLRDHFQRSVMAEVARQTGRAPQQVQQQQIPQQFSDPRVDQILTSLQQQERERAAEAEAISNAATERFIAAKTEDGQPAHPFVDNVLDDMVGRVQFIRKANPSMPHEEILKQAYDAAVWANPETRAVLLGQQQAKAQTNEETLRKVEAAKRASRTNLPKRGSVPAGEAKGSMDETIRDTYRQLTTG